MDIEGEELLVKLSKARRERLKQLILAAYRKIYPRSVRQGTPLPPAKLDFIIQNKTHLEMQYITNIYAIINNFMNYVCTQPIYNDNYLSDLFKNLIKGIDNFLGERNYKYGIFGSNAWYNLFGDTAPALSDYELSAINKYNTKEYIFIVRNTDNEKLKLLQLKSINALKTIADYLNTNVQKALEEIKGIEEFSYFNGKEVFIGVKPYSDRKVLFNNAFTFSITLFITKSDAIIPENEIIVDREFANVEEYDKFIEEYQILKGNIKRRKGEYHLPKHSFQLASYIGKHKQSKSKSKQMQVDQPLPAPKPARRKRKTREEEEKEEKEEQYAKALNKELQQAGRAARAKLRAIAKNDAPKIIISKDQETEEITTTIDNGMNGGGMKSKKKNQKKSKKKGGVFEDDDVNSFLKFKLFTFSFNIFPKIYNKDNKENKENEELLFDNFDKLLAKKEDDKNEQYFGLEGLYILNRIMQQKVFIPRDRYNPYKIRNFIFDKFMFSIYDPRSIQKFEKMWYISYLFEKTFKKLNIVKEFINDKMKRDILEFHQELNEFKETIESNVIEILRPYINKTIFNINDELSKMEFYINDADRTETQKSSENEKLTGIFILGGDALRRYKYDAAKTKDIDAKIYIPVKIPFGDNDQENIDSGYHNQEKIFRCITSNLIKLLVYLENNKKTLFQSLLETSHKEIEERGGSDNKITIDIDFIDENEKNVNFKFRKSGKPFFPADLYSIDYKCIFKVKYMAQTIMIPIEIAFIDIVVKQEGKKYYNNFSVFAENNLPLAKLEFLLSDLLNTYNENDLSLLRFFAGKSDKDYDRLNTLWDIYFTQKSASPIYSIDSQNTIHFKNQENINTNEKLNTISDYSINTTDNNLYKSIMSILDHLIEKNRINNIKQFGDYENPNNLFDSPADASIKTGGLLKDVKQQRQSSLPNFFIDNKNKNKLSYLIEQELINNYNDFDFRYTENTITKDLIRLMNLSFEKMEERITTIDNKDSGIYPIINNFNYNFYNEFATLLKPEVFLKNDNPMILNFTKLASNIKRMEENINIFFGKKNISERLSVRMSNIKVNNENDDDNEDDD
jgi:hypothetical protein